MIVAKFKDGSEVGLCIGSFPNRKSKTLYVFRSDEKGARSYPLAYFHDDKSAAEAEEVLEILTRVTTLP